MNGSLSTLPVSEDPRSDLPIGLEPIVSELRQVLQDELAHAEKKAWDSLARYKFQMFGYWAAIWVHLNRVGRFGRPNPWKSLVVFAREASGYNPMNGA